MHEAACWSVRVVTNAAADNSSREIPFTAPQSVLAMYNALHRHLPYAGERSPFPSAARLAHFWGSSSTPTLQDRGQLGWTGMFLWQQREKKKTNA